MAIKNVKLKNGEDVLYPKTKISNILNEDGTTWEEKVVEANPSENSTADLTKIKIGNIVYKMASQVEANPSGEATTDLTKIKIADTIYRLASGSSGSSGGDSGSSGGSGNGVETLVLNEADFMTIMSLIEGGEGGESIPTKGNLTGSYEMKLYGLIQGTADGMTASFPVGGGASMAPLATMLDIMIFVNGSLIVIILQATPAGGTNVA